MAEKIAVDSGNPYRGVGGKFGTSPDQKLADSFKKLAATKLVSPKDNEKKIKSLKGDAEAKLASLRGTTSGTDDSGGKLSLSADQLDAVEKYNSSAYLLINRLARGQDGLSLEGSGYKKTVDDLNSAIDKTKLSEDTTLYRGVARYAAEEMNLRVGQEISDGGFLSTSRERETASLFGGGQGYVFEINAPKGTPTLDMNNIEGFNYDHPYKESLLKTHTKMIIRSMEEVGEETIVKVDIA